VVLDAEIALEYDNTADETVNNDFEEEMGEWMS
jgi:hypothetical protein